MAWAAARFAHLADFGFTRAKQTGVLSSFPFLFGEGRAIGQVGLPVRAYVGYGVLPLGYSQQGCAIVDDRLPALLPEVNNVLSSVFLKVGEHCFLVWSEQFAGELAEDGQVGEVQWCR